MRQGRRRFAFTLTELLIVVGLIAVLICLFLPVLSKAREAANAAVCLSNLRQMGMAWTMYVSENRGRIPEYVWSTPTTPDVSWKGYWLGMVDHYETRGDIFICPTASEESPFRAGLQRGYGTAKIAWTGRYASSGCGVKFNPTKFRDGSYGYNRYMTVGGTVANSPKITSIKNTSNTPLFVDSAYPDVRPLNGVAEAPVLAPPDLNGGSLNAGSPEHWRFLLARHGRAVNASMADGSARRVPLEETYQLAWSTDWSPYRLDHLPSY